MSAESGRVSPTLMFVVFFLVAMASCPVIGDHDGGGWQLLFWASATCSAAAFQFGIAPRRTTSAAGWPGAGWLFGMGGVGVAVVFGGIGVWVRDQLSDPLLTVSIITMAVGITWSLAAVVLLILKLVFDEADGHGQ
jgi:hypothetical protein